MTTLTRTVAALAVAAGPTLASALEIPVQLRHPPLQFEGAAPGGAHPIGGPSKHFIDFANARLAPFDIRFEAHTSGKMNKADEADMLPPAVDIKEWGTLHKAVAAGALTAAVGVPADSKLAFGEYYSGGMPFGLTSDEFIAFLYQGGGLALEQDIYDKAFGPNLVILPIAVAGAQAAGFFPEPIPDPAADAALTPEAALSAFCAKPWSVRYPGGAQAVLEAACASVGGGVDRIGAGTRCEDPRKACGPDHPDNPVAFEPTRLTFGGFVVGGVPHAMAANGNIDAYELNAPADDVQFLKMVKGVTDQPDDAVDLSDVAPAYHYGSSWHQPSFYAELLINRAYWESLSERDRTLIELAARASVLENFAIRTSIQGAAIDTLSGNGVTHLRWPDAVLALMRESAPAALDALAAESTAKGDDSLRRTLDAMRDFARANQVYFDYDDVMQGASETPSSP